MSRHCCYNRVSQKAHLYDNRIYLFQNGLARFPRISMRLNKDCLQMTKTQKESCILWTKDGILLGKSWTLIKHYFLCDDFRMPYGNTKDVWHSCYTLVIESDSGRIVMQTKQTQNTEWSQTSYRVSLFLFFFSRRSVYSNCITERVQDTK